MAQAQKSGKSPYNKYNKRPYRYSQLYYDWHKARGENNDRLTRELAIKHSSNWLKTNLKEEKEAA